MQALYFQKETYERLVTFVRNICAIFPHTESTHYEWMKQQKTASYYFDQEALGNEQIIKTLSHLLSFRAKVLIEGLFNNSPVNEPPTSPMVYLLMQRKTNFSIKNVLNPWCRIIQNFYIQTFMDAINKSH